MSKISYIENLDTWQEGFYYYRPVQVRFSETDMFGHMNNTVPFVYFEEARCAFLAEVGMLERWLSHEADDIPVVSDLQCNFLQQVFFNDALKVYVKAAHIGRSSLDIHYKVVNQRDELVLTGRSLLVQINRHTGRPSAISDEMRAAMLHYRA